MPESQNVKSDFLKFTAKTQVFKWENLCFYFDELKHQSKTAFFKKKGLHNKKNMLYYVCKFVLKWVLYEYFVRRNYTNIQCL